MLEKWNEILNVGYNSEILIVVCGLLFLFGLFKLLRSSITVILWVILIGIGAYGVAYGVEQSSNTFTVKLGNDLKALVEPGRKVSVNALRSLCAGLGSVDSVEQ